MLFVEIPHNGRPRVWQAEDWDEAARRAAIDGEMPAIEVMGPDRAVEFFGGEVPEDAAGTLADHGAVAVVFRLPGRDPEVMPPSEAPALHQVVHEWIGHDLHALFVLKDEKDISSFLTRYDGHMAAAAKAAVKAALDE